MRYLIVEKMACGETRWYRGVWLWRPFQKDVPSMSWNKESARRFVKERTARKHLARLIQWSKGSGEFEIEEETNG